MKSTVALVVLLFSNSVFAADNCKSLTDSAEKSVDAGQWAKAIDAGKKAVKLCAAEKQKTARAHMSLATAYNATQDYQQTVFWSKEALKQEPGLALAFMNMCAGYMSMKQYDEAIAACKQGATKESPWKAKINFNTGLAIYNKYVGLSQLEKLTEAEPYFRTTQKLDPNIVDSYRFLGLIRMNAGDTKDALAQFTKCCDMKNDECCKNKQIVASIAPAAPATQAKTAPASRDEEKLWAQIKANYLKKGVPAASVDPMIQNMRANFAAMPVDQRIQALQGMANEQ